MKYNYVPVYFTPEDLMYRLRSARFAVAALCFLAPVVAHANVITTYAMTFTTTGGSPNPTSGVFSFDSTANTFTSFLVNWNGAALNFRAAANAGPSSIGTCTAAGANPAQMSLTVILGLDTGCSGTKQFQFIQGGTDLLGSVFGPNADGITISDPQQSLGNFASGTYSVAVVTPEPSPQATFAWGLAVLVILIRLRRDGSGRKGDAPNLANLELH